MDRKRSLGRIALRNLGVVLAALLLFAGWVWSCETDRAPEPVQRAYDWAATILLGVDPLTRCTEVRPHYRGADLRKCFVLGPSRTFKGIFINEFEGDRFLENAVPAQTYKPADSVSFFIDYRTDLSSAPVLSEVTEGSRIFEVVVTGRKTIEPVRTGYIGLQDQILFVDRVVSAKLVQVFPEYVPDNVLVR